LKKSEFWQFNLSPVLKATNHMIILLSPAKSLDFQSKIIGQNFSVLHFQKSVQKLIFALKKLSVFELQNLMKISPKLAELNFERFQNFSEKFDFENSRQALMAFDGDVYDGIDKKNFTTADFEFAQKNLRILSGLYGLLRPLDLIQPYRLEMGSDFKKSTIEKNLGVKNLYQFWGDEISLHLNETCKINGAKHVVNLASEEYFAAVNPKIIASEIINIFFKERKGDILKIIGINAKKARGLMANFIIKNQISQPQDLQKFNQANYQFAPDLSNKNNLTFIR
jgi:cytoplasmic iron level regulating protein YaaA (DUF328/UPF0246 family)